jgi:hypothetical protein
MSDNLFYLKDGEQGFGTEEWEYMKDRVVNFIIDSIIVKFEYRVCKGCGFKPGILHHKLLSNQHGVTFQKT